MRMERRKTSPIIAFVLAAIIAASSLPIPCAAWNGPQWIKSVSKVSQYTKPDLHNLFYAEHKNTDTSMATACDNLSVAIAENNPRKMARAYDAIAWNYFCHNNFSKALKTYERILQMCDSAGYRRGLVISYHNIANTLTMMNLYNEANEYDHKAINIAYELNDETDISKISKTLGLMCINHHLYKQAAEYLNRALDIDTKMDARTDNNADDVAYDYMFMGLADYRNSLDTFNDSLLHQAKNKSLRAYKTFKKSGNAMATADICKNLIQIYLRIAQTSSGKQREMFMDSCQFYHSIGLTALKKEKNEISQTDYLLVEGKLALLNNDYATARQKLKAAEAAIKKDPLNIFHVKYGFMMASYLEAVGNYRHSFEWADWTAKLEKQQLNREYAVKSAQLSLKTEQDNILQQSQIDREHEYIMRREQEIRLVVITASTLLVLIMITVLAIIVRNSLKRKKRLGKKLMVRNIELESQRDQLEFINDQLASSINFAHHLQTTMLPTAEQLNELFGQAMILWRPLDVVSGDFYWATQSGRRKLVTIADCTGHGVPGGFMSMLGISILSDISLSPGFKNGQMTAANVLDIMRQKVVESLRQSEESSMALDGMDMAVCIIDEDSPTLQFAGAFRPIVIVRDGKVIEHKGDRMPISYISDSPKPFKTVNIDIEPGDTIFIFSDGITDQFGYNENGDTTKFTGRRLYKILQETAGQPLDEISKQINAAIENWRAPANQKTIVQTDDIILLGIRF